MHDIVIEEIREEYLFAKTEQTILEIESSLLWKILIRVNDLLPIFLGKTSVIA